MPDDEARQRALARVGMTLKGKWRLDQLIGVGGMASVYAATHRNQKRAALKLLHPELSLSVQVRNRFLREGYAANTVGHRGAVEVFDDDVTDDGAAFLVMELLDGETLEARAQRSGYLLPPSEVLSLVDQLLDVLAAAHDKGIVHRDLKPENLFFTTKGELKVLDFGIARLAELSGDTGVNTRAGTVMGTPAFMAPEQARGRWNEVDARTDLWAVGATMFTLLTSRCVHESETANEQLALAMTAAARPIRELLPTLHASVAEIVDRALRYHKNERYADARSMLTAVRAAYWELEGAISQAPDTPAVPPEPSRARVSQDAATQIAPEGHSYISAPNANALPPEPVHKSVVAVSSSVTPTAHRDRTRFIAAGVGSVALLAIGIFVATRSGTPPVVTPGAQPTQTVTSTATHATPTVTPSLTGTAIPVPEPTTSPSASNTGVAPKATAKIKPPASATAPTTAPTQVVIKKKKPPVIE